MSGCLGGRGLGAIAAARLRHQLVKLADGGMRRCFLSTVRSAVSTTHLDGWSGKFNILYQDKLQQYP